MSQARHILSPPKMGREGDRVSEQIAAEFTLSDDESLALTLAKLALTETDLEGDASHSDRMVKRTVIRRYCDLVMEQLDVPPCGDGNDELDWRSSRAEAVDVAARAGPDDLPAALRDVLAPLGADARRYVITSPDVALAALRAIEERRRALVLMIELAAFHPWPDGTKWEQEVRSVGLRQLVEGMTAPVDHELLEEIDRQLKASLRRLSRRELDKRKLAAIAVGGAAAGLLTGGLAAPLIGSAIGGAMGLSGAAATSAGLALLGGGAVAAGGLGVAGGTAIVAGVVGVSSAGMGAAGTWLKGARPNDVIVESAKLEVSFKYLLIREERSEELQRLVVERLQQQIAGLVTEINELTSIVAEQQGSNAERDELQVRLAEETEKRTVLERTLSDIQRMQTEAAHGRS